MSFDCALNYLLSLFVLSKNENENIRNYARNICTHKQTVTDVQLILYKFSNKSHNNTHNTLTTDEHNVVNTKCINVKCLHWCFLSVSVGISLMCGLNFYSLIFIGYFYHIHIHICKTR